MNTLKCYATKRYNGLYLITAFKPTIAKVVGTTHVDAYIKYGDPIGYTNVSLLFGWSILDDEVDEVVSQPRRMHLFGGIEEPYTHMLEYNLKTKLYKVSAKYKDCFIDNMCSWSVRALFGVTDLQGTQAVHFHGILGDNNG